MGSRIRFSVMLVFLLAFIVACNAISSGTGDTESPPVEESVEPPTPAPPTATPRPNAELTIVGEEEVVYDWDVHGCEAEAIPDLAARAIRNADGQVQLYIIGTSGYRMTGPDLNSVTIDCNAVSGSAKAADPALFTDHEWVASPYTEDGETVYALVHNEYQGHIHHSGECPQNDVFACLFTSITMKISSDGGATFDYIAPPPAHHVASLPEAYEAGLGALGLRAPSNIIKGPDGYYYSFLNAAGVNSQPQWVCLMRTDDLSDPSSWRFWDGTGFEGRFINPYTEDPEDRDDHRCKPLASEQIGASLNDSITYNTELERYVLVGNSADHIDGREVWGWYYSFSEDLIHWTHRKLLAEMPLPWSVDSSGSDLSYLYPSLLDPDSESLSFSTTDMNAYLYVTRNNLGHGTLDRDLVRYEVAFSLVD